MAILTPIAIGQTGENWRDYINANFQNATRYTQNEMLCLTTTQINSIPSDYVAVGKRVFDITTKQTKEWSGSGWVVVPYLTVGSVQPTDGLWLEEV